MTLPRRLRRAALACCLAAASFAPSLASGADPVFLAAAGPRVGSCAPSEMVHAAMSRRGHKPTVLAAMPDDRMLVEWSDGRLWVVLAVSRPVSCVLAVGVKA